jgi:hypothetical protein
MSLEIIVAVVLSLASCGLSVAALLKRRKLSLPQIATLACDHGAQLESPTMPRWKLAHEAGVRLDLGDNGKRDYDDAQIRLAVDAEMQRRGWVKK